MKTHLQLSFLETSMVTHRFGGRMVTQLLKVRGIENLLSSLGLSQLISEPTKFEPTKNPSCIDLIITDQPNLVLGSGTRHSLDSCCHHQITYCKMNFSIPPPPPPPPKRKAPKILPLLVNNLFIINCKEKAKLFTDFFSQKCKPVINDSFFTRLQSSDK